MSDKMLRRIHGIGFLTICAGMVFFTDRVGPMGGLFLILAIGAGLLHWYDRKKRNEPK